MTILSNKIGTTTDEKIIAKLKKKIEMTVKGYAINIGVNNSEEFREAIRGMAENLDVTKKYKIFLVTEIEEMEKRIRTLRKEVIKPQEDGSVLYLGGKKEVDVLLRGDVNFGQCYVEALHKSFREEIPDYETKVVTIDGSFDSEKVQFFHKKTFSNYKEDEGEIHDWEVNSLFAYIPERFFKKEECDE